MTKQTKRLTLFALCFLVMIGITVGAYAAWDIGLRRSQEETGNTGIILYIGLEDAGKLEVSSGLLVPYDQSLEGINGDYVNYITVTGKVKADPSAVYDISVALTKPSPFSANARLYAKVGEFPETPDAQLLTGATEITSDVKTVITGLTDLQNNDSETTAGVRPFSFIIFLDSDDEADMGKEFSFQVFVENKVQAS